MDQTKGRRRRGRDVVVVGAGLAGLVCAAALARRGLRVLVLEQHALAGGYCTSWRRSVKVGNVRGRFTFDAGIHDISGLDDEGIVWRTLVNLGAEAEIQRVPVDHAYVVHGEAFRIPHGRRALEEELAARFPRERARIGDLLDEIAAIHAEVSQYRGGAGLEPMMGLRRARHWFGASWPSFVRAFVRDQGLRDLLMMPCGYLGHDLEAIDAVTMALVVGGYWLVGGRMTAGGSQRLADGLVRALRDAGGALRVRTDVARIRVSEGHVQGVTLASGESIDASVVVSNASLDRTLLELVGADALSPSIEQHARRLRPSTSAFAVFLALDVKPRIAAMTLANTPMPLSIANPSATDDSLAPPGCSAVTLMSLVPPTEAVTWDRAADDYHARRRVACDALVAAATELVPEIAGHILHREDATPATFARYTRATAGAIYGMVSDSAVDVTTDIDGLFVCGSSVAPGPGVEAVVRSGLRAADLIAPRWAPTSPRGTACAT